MEAGTSNGRVPDRQLGGRFLASMSAMWIIPTATDFYRESFTISPAAQNFLC
jgi:hypothetical protein